MAAKKKPACARRTRASLNRDTATRHNVAAMENARPHFATISSQFLRYTIIGALAFLIDVTLLLWLANIGVHYLVANTIAFLGANLFNVMAAHQFVFAANGRISDWRALYLVILAVSFVGLLINDFLVYVAAGVFGLPLVAAKVIATLVTLLWNFGARKRLAYY